MPVLYGDVAILGNNFVGQILALTLAQQGFDCIVLAPQGRSHIPPLDISLNLFSLQLLKQLKVQWPTVHYFGKITVWLDEWEKRLSLHAHTIGSEWLGGIVSSQQLREHLTEAMHKEGRIVQVCPVEFTGLRLEGSRMIVSDAVQHCSVPLVLITDPTILPQSSPIVQEKSYDEWALTAIVKTQMPMRHEAFQVFLPEGPLALLPTTQAQESALIWSAKRTILDEYPPTKLAHRLKNIFGEHDWQFEGAFHYQPLQRRERSSLIAPRCVYLGSAAHLIHPHAGQGLNIGLRDVAECVTLLINAKKAQKDWGKPELLKEYEQAAKLRHYLFSQTIDWMRQQFSRPPGWCRWGTEQVFTVLNRFEPLQKPWLLAATGCWPLPPNWMPAIDAWRFE